VFLLSSRRQICATRYVCNFQPPFCFARYVLSWEAQQTEPTHSDTQAT
jgi:hypothetical protein